MRRKASIIAALAAIATTVPAHAQSGNWYNVVDSNLSNIGMICPYVSGSARNISIDAYNNDTGSVLISARYDYRCGDSTSSDTVYMTLTYSGRICHAFAFYGKRCNLYGQVIDR